MTVRELIEDLLNYPLDYEVMLASDEEGNAVLPLVDIADGVDDGDDFEVGTGDSVVVLWP
jgi:hypothetical protein